MLLLACDRSGSRLRSWFNLESNAPSCVRLALSAAKCGLTAYRAEREAKSAKKNIISSNLICRFVPSARYTLSTVFREGVQFTMCGVISLDSDKGPSGQGQPYLSLYVPLRHFCYENGTF